MSPQATTFVDPPLPAGYRLVAFETIGSTNDEAQRFAVAGEPERLIVSAAAQTRGRGRQQRSWISPIGGLYCSFLFRPDCPLLRAPEMGFVAAVAVAEAVAELLGDGGLVSCKWPNDVLVSGRKIAGILIESSGGAHNRLDWLVVGIGLNIAEAPDAAELLYPATCLATEGAPGVTPAIALAAIAAVLASWYERWTIEGFAPVRHAWRVRGPQVGAKLAIRGGAADAEGEFVELDASGALVLRTLQGQRVITAGDCFPVATAAG